MHQTRVFHGPVLARTLLIAAAAGAAAVLGPARPAIADDPKKIPTEARVPLWNQHDDFRNLYRARTTDIRRTDDQGQDVAVPYQDLYDPALRLNVRFRPADGPIWQRF